MDISTQINNPQVNPHGTLVEDYLNYWIEGAENTTSSGLVKELTKNFLDKLEPNLATEYKNFVSKLYKSMQSLESAREEHPKNNSISQLSEIIKAKT